MKRHILATLGYIVATFVIQGLSHFLVFARHYAGQTILRAEPSFALGFASMVIQGAVLSYVFGTSRLNSGRLFDAVKTAWLFGLFLVSYIALAEAGKYAVPDVLSWIGVEAASGLVQFTLAGMLLWLAHRGSQGEAR